MAKGNGGQKISPDPYNEVTNRDETMGDLSGGGLYASYDEVMSGHLASGPKWATSPNAACGGGIFGGPASGEPNPAGMGTNNEDVSY